MSEFTGERVIPGQVEGSLWAEHIARYLWAARFAAGKRVLDVGCGTGYGSAEMARTALEVIGVDRAPEAIAYAAEHYPQARFAQRTATDLPFPDGSFDLVTAFEIIEHLEDWTAMLREARRVLTPEGMLLVSTPNKLYYAESRADAGPNPFHAHEFEYAEFRDALCAHFSHVRILVQDRTESIVFYDVPGSSDGMVALADSPLQSNFFIAACSQALLPPLHPFIYVPKAANLLREREHHIHLLEKELVQVRTWQQETAASRDALLTEHEALQKHLDHQNQWARQLESNWHSEQERVKELQDHITALQREMETEQARAAGIIAELNRENEQKTQWAIDIEKRLTEELERRTAALATMQESLGQAESTANERTAWAQTLDREINELYVLLAMIRDSRWVKLGRLVGVGPKL